MIRYPYDGAQVVRDIAEIDPRWIVKAANRSKRLVKAGAYSEKSSIWSTIKPVFMLLQHNKCAYCERQLEGPDHGTIDFDVEHYRPKNAVPVWPDPVRHGGLAYDFQTGAQGRGYHWLAYELENYAASCKICNTIQKLNFFPIAGSRAEQPATGTSVENARRALANEEPFLCYPIGEADEDPQALITFDVTTAIPAAQDDARRRRGQVMIDFFDLNGRELLHLERSRMISLVGTALLKRGNEFSSPLHAKEQDAFGSASYPHASCIRAFVRLWTTDPARAGAVHDACAKNALAALA